MPGAILKTKKKYHINVSRYQLVVKPKDRATDFVENLSFTYVGIFCGTYV